MVQVQVEWESGVDGPPGDAGWDVLMHLHSARLVARSRTTSTEAGLLRLPGGDVPVHRKLYEYKTIGARLRGAFRTTFAAPGRARREAEVLRTLASLGEPPLAPGVVAVAERRVGGFLETAVLVTRTLPGAATLDEVVPQPDVAAAAGLMLGRLHAAGYAGLGLRERDLVVTSSTDGSLHVAKVDTPRLLQPAGRERERARLDDLARLLSFPGATGSGQGADALRDALLDAYSGLVDAPTTTSLEEALARARLERDRDEARRRPRPGC